MAGKALLLTLLLLAYDTHSILGACDEVAFSTYLDGILAEYDRENPPGSHVVIKVGFNARHVNIDERSSTVRMLADLHMDWKDTRIVWNETEWGCNTSLVSAERLWLPDMMLVNAAGVSLDDESLRARLSSDGAISWVKRLDVTVPIALQLTNWPKDLQQAKFKFSTRSHSIDELSMVLVEPHQSGMFDSGAWEVVAIASSAGTWKATDSSVRALVTWYVDVTRRSPSHAVATSAVLAATVMMLIAAMLLPPSARHSLCACASFTAALWLITALIRVAPSAWVPSALVSLSVVCGSGGAAAAAAAIVSRIAACSSPPPRHMRNLLAAVSTVCKLAPDESTSSNERIAWVAAARLLDLVLLVALGIALLAAVCIYL